jgi:phospholipid/cholesterol/gamma-HCH transport system substrate-binding protein
VSKEFRIGLIAIVAGVLLYYGFNYLKGTDIFANTNRFYVEYDNTDGLTEGSIVKTKGVQIGRVSNVLFQPEKGNVLVELSIQENIQLGDSTIAELTADGLLGGKAIIIYRKTHKTTLEPGSQLIAKVDKGLSEMLESAKPITDNIQVTIRLINEILLGMQGSGEKFNSAVGNMDTVLMDIRYVLEQNDNKVEQAISKIDTIITDLGKAIKPLEATMQNLEVFSDSLKSTEFKATVASTNQLLQNINQTLDSLKNENGTIGRLMTDDSLYNTLNKTLLDLDKLIIHFNNYPKDFMGPLGRKHKKLEGLKED